MIGAVTREDLIEQSLKEWVRAALLARGFPQPEWRLEDSYPYGIETLDVNLIATGFSFDDGGKQAELGSNLKERAHTVEFFVFGKTNTYAKSLANAIKFSLEQQDSGMLPLLDITQAGKPIIDYLYLDGVHAHKQPLPEPEPWQEYTWIVTVRVTDIYYPSLT